jgi:hypothetical protein
MERMEIYKNMHEEEHFKSWPARAFKALEDPATARVLLTEFYEQYPHAACTGLFLLLASELFFTGRMEEEEFERVMTKYIKAVEEEKREEAQK